jgi:hypothetical protein
VRTPTLREHQMNLPAGFSNKFKETRGQSSRVELCLVSSLYADCCKLVPSAHTPTAVQCGHRAVWHATGTLCSPCAIAIALPVFTRQGLSLIQPRRRVASQFPNHEYQAPLSFSFSIRSDSVSSPRQRAQDRPPITQQQNINAHRPSVDTLTKRFNQ